MNNTYINKLLVLGISAILLSCGHNQSHMKESGKAFTSYWDGFDFSDKNYVDNPGITEPKFVAFCKYLTSMDRYESRRQIDTLLHRSLEGNIDMFENIMELAERYLADPNSPYRNEETYIKFLEYTISEPHLTDAYKERPRFQLSIANKNRVGTKAADIKYVTREGTTGKLSAIDSRYTLIYFNNPDCHDCKRVTDYLKHSTTISRMQKCQSLTILAVYPDRDLSSWETHKKEYPKNWIVSRYASEENMDSYNLPAIPNLYLLDQSKRVLLKDAPIESIEEYLSNHIKKANYETDKDYSRPLSCHP